MQINLFLNKIFKTVTEAFKNCLRRFPVTVCFIFALTVYLLYLIGREPQSSTLMLVTGYYLSVGTLLSLSLHLWTEEMSRRATKLITHLVGHIALITDAVYLYFYEFGDSPTEIGFAHAAGLLTIGLSLFFLSFLREKNDIPSWNFALQSIYTLVISNFIGWVMCAGLCLLIASLHTLFGIQFSDRWYLYTATITCLWLPLMLFVGLLPQGGKKHNRTPQNNGFLNGIMHYLFLPLTIAYLIVLYAYAVQILIRWELPNGWVSQLVLAIMAVCLILEFGLYPSRIKEGKKWDVLMARWLPILILPLLLLMTTGIVRRFNDYGVTISRLYLITLNGWMYFVCIGLFLTKGKRINWIPISFALVFLLTSVLPINFASYTRRTIYNEVEAEVKATCQEKLPMDNDAYERWLEQYPRKQAQQINSKMQYLNKWFGHKSYAPIATEDISYSLYNFDYCCADGDTVSVTNKQEMSFRSHASGIEIPKGYTKVYIISNKDRTLPDSVFNADVFAFPLIQPEDSINDIVYFDKRTLEDMNNKNELDPVEFRCKSKVHRFYLNRFSSSSLYQSNGQVLFSFSGILFEK